MTHVFPLRQAARLVRGPGRQQQVASLYRTARSPTRDTQTPLLLFARLGEASFASWHLLRGGAFCSESAAFLAPPRAVRSRPACCAGCACRARLAQRFAGVGRAPVPFFTSRLLPPNSAGWVPFLAAIACSARASRSGRALGDVGEVTVPGVFLSTSSARPYRRRFACEGRWRQSAAARWRGRRRPGLVNDGRSGGAGAPNR